jgi:palmitoyl-protein thioesterase
MNDSVEAFQQAIRNNTALQKGFHALGFSQGNNVIRGYMTKYNDPPVQTFLSLNGVNAGTARVPHCFDGANRWCHFLTESASRSAYTTFAQQHSFQANYWRDVDHYDMYLEYSQLAVWNNEVEHDQKQLYKENWAKTDQFVWVMATEDELVYPAESEHWGEPMTGTDNDVRLMVETKWYIDDSFGLRTADEAGKNQFESFVGSHLQFSLDDLQRWTTTYFD